MIYCWSFIVQWNDQERYWRYNDHSSGVDSTWFTIRCSETNQTIRDDRNCGLKLYFLQFILIVEAKNFTLICMQWEYLYHYFRWNSWFTLFNLPKCVKNFFSLKCQMSERCLLRFFNEISNDNRRKNVDRCKNDHNDLSCSIISLWQHLKKPVSSCESIATASHFDYTFYASTYSIIG